MGYAVELYVDAQMEFAVRGLWQTLADRGVTSLMPDLGARPHISLTVFDELYPPDVHEALQNFAAEVAPIPLQFSAVGIFPTAEGVVFLAPVVTQRLLDVHADFHARMAALGRQSLPYYRPGNWVPHCTVAMNLPPEQIPTAVAICKAAPVFHAFSLVGLDLIEFRPVKTIYEFPLVG
ncbi:MAG: 2'-5' RNA ligase family protein [Caldilineaceae bacterium]|nr:2'-5' RNA ligase family protein [Caldilineaceae bacterium]MCB0144037.1 2'-5' RNA ligase family protein [Caldilineaceae bacterium]